MLLFITKLGLTKNIFFKEVLAKAPSPIDLTELGTLIERIPSEPQKAYSPISIILSGIIKSITSLNIVNPGA